jgi:hypothetical protein
MKLYLTSLAAVCLLTSCGGGSSSDPYQQAVDQAETTEAQAESLAVAAPCSASTQCGTLELVSPTGTCFTPSYQAYSLISSSASAASSAAAEERSQAAAAVSLAPGPKVCSFSGMGPQAAVCSSGTCSLPK